MSVVLKRLTSHEILQFKLPKLIPGRPWERPSWYYNELDRELARLRGISPIPRKRGRPKSLKPASVSEDKSIKKRGRGRPRLPEGSVRLRNPYYIELNTSAMAKKDWQQYEGEEYGRGKRTSTFQPPSYVNIYKRYFFDY